MPRKHSREPASKREYGKGRKKPLRILLTEGERARLDAAAKEEGLDTSTWARFVLLARPMIGGRSFRELQAAMHQFAVIEHNRRNPKDAIKPEPRALDRVKITEDETEDHPKLAKAVRAWIMNRHLKWEKLPTAFDYWRMYYERNSWGMTDGEIREDEQIRQFIACHILDTARDEIIEEAELRDDQEDRWFDAYFSSKTPEQVREWIACNLLHIRHVPRV